VERAVLTGHAGAVCGLAVAPDGAWLATVGDDRTLRVWDQAAGHTSAVMRVDGPLTNCEWSPSGKSIAAAGAGGWYCFTFRRLPVQAILASSRLRTPSRPPFREQSQYSTSWFGRRTRRKPRSLMGWVTWADHRHLALNRRLAQPAEPRCPVPRAQVATGQAPALQAGGYARAPAWTAATIGDHAGRRWAVIGYRDRRRSLPPQHARTVALSKFSLITFRSGRCGWLAHVSSGKTPSSQPASGLCSTGPDGRRALAGTAAGFALAAAYGAVRLITHQATRKSQLPLGPFMLLGPIVVIALLHAVGP
jgi:hypothetical protein